MRYVTQYSIRPAAIKLLNLLVAKPGLTASDIKAQPNITITPLERLIQQGYVLSRFEPPFWKPGKVKPKKKHYVTEKGFTAHEFTIRQRYTIAENSNAPHRHGTRRTSS